MELDNSLDELEEDLADARAGEAAWAEYIASGRQSISLEEYARTHGIKLNELEEDLEDARAGEAAWAEYIASGRKSISSEELKKELGLD